MKETPTVAETHDQEPMLQMQADMLLLIDLVTQASRKSELLERSALQEAFCEAAAQAGAVPSAQSVVESAQKRFDAVLHSPDGAVPMHFRNKKQMRESADKVPTIQAQREAFSRRELIATLLSGRVTEALAAVEAEQNAQQSELEPVREITPEYFDTVLEQVLAGEYGVGCFESWDHKQYLHFRPLLSSSYARMLSTKNSPTEAIVDMVRETSRIYPALTPIELFEAPPFEMQPDEIQAALSQIAQDPQTKDIRFTTNSIDEVLLYSTRYIDDDYAEALADVALEAAMNP